MAVSLLTYDQTAAEPHTLWQRLTPRAPSGHGRAMVCLPESGTEACILPVVQGNRVQIEQHDADPTKRFQQAYREIGSRRGVRATASGRRLANAIWLESGVRGASWLLHRLASERHPDNLRAAAEVIAELGSVALKPLLLMFESSTPRHSWPALLDALGWMKLEDVTSIGCSRIEGILQRLVTSEDSDVAEAAVRASRCLPRDRALSFLESVEPIVAPPVKAEISDMLAQLDD